MIGLIGLLALGNTQFQVVSVADLLKQVGPDKYAGVSTNLGNEVVIVRGATADPAFEQAIAACLGAEWHEVDGKLRLVRDQSDRTRELADARRPGIEQALRRLPSLGGTSEERNQEAIRQTLAFAQEYRLTRPTDFRPQIAYPTYRLLCSALRSIGAERLATIEDRTTQTYAVTPVGTQAKLTDTFKADLATAEADRGELAQALDGIRSEISGSSVEGWILSRFGMFASPKRTAEVLVVIGRSEETILASLGLFDSTGSLIDSADAQISSLGEAASTIIVDDFDLNAFEQAFLLKARSSTIADERLVTLEPLSVVIPRALEAYAQPSTTPVIVLADDRLVALAAKSVSGGRFRCSAFLNEGAAQGLLRFQKSGPWLIGSPAHGISAEERRLPRGDTARLLENAQIDTLALADFARRTSLTVQSSRLLRHLLNYLEANDGEVTPPAPGPEQGLQLLGCLRQVVGKKPGASWTFAVEAIPEDGRRAIVSWARAGLLTLEGNVADIARNGSEAILGNSAPQGTLVTLAETNSIVIRKPNASGFLMYFHGSAEIRDFLRSTPETSPDAEAYYGGVVESASVRRWTVSVAFPNGQSLTGHFIDPPENIKRSEFSQLPPDFIRELRIR